jgi:hypothetical protein
VCTSHQFADQSRLSRFFRRLNRPVLWAFLLLRLGFAGLGSATAANIQNAPVTPAGLGAQFAIADFDGDGRPDLASIQPEPSNVAGRATYWIQLQLSGSERQSIQVVAPAGGLLIEAVDVDNGNHFIDLILTTAWFKQPVAILLNDGHGRFSRVEPAAFPGAFATSTTSWVSNHDHTMDAVGTPPPPRSGMYSKAMRLPGIRPQPDSTSSSNAGFLFVFFFISHAGRAPPLEISPL